MQGTRGGKLSAWATVCSLFSTIQGKTVKGRMALRHLIDLKTSKNENFKIQDRSLRSCFGGLDTSTADDFFEQQYQQMAFFEQQIGKLFWPMQVSTLLSNIAFRLLSIWLQTLGAIKSELCLRLFPNFVCSHLKQLCCNTDVQWESELMPLSKAFFGMIVDLNLLLCTKFDLGHADLVLCLIFTPNA